MKTKMYKELLTITLFLFGFILELWKILLPYGDKIITEFEKQETSYHLVIEQFTIVLVLSIALWSIITSCIVFVVDKIIE